MPLPLAAEAPWPAATKSFMPFGYREARDGSAAVVPFTAPGLPMLMAAFQMAGGECAAFVVTPLAGGALVLLTFAIGARLRSRAAGLIAAWLVATSPGFLFMAMWPMTDVPSAACTALMMYLFLRPSPAAALGAGLAGSLAVLVRFNLALVVAAAGMWLIGDAFATRSGSRGWRRLGLFAAGLLPGVALIAGLNTRWFGSPWSSGYGTVEQLFSWSRAGGNAWGYVIWITETSPLAWIGLFGIACPVLWFWTRADSRRAALLFGATIVATAFPYLFWEPNPEWWYLRYVLPAWSAIFVASAVALDRLRALGRASSAAVIVVVIAAGVLGVMTARTRGVFEIGRTEQRYAIVGRLVREVTDPAAVIVTRMHSGTARYYAGREILRWDHIDPAWVDRALEWLAARGRQPYFLLEDFERPVFEQHLAGTAAAAVLATPPIAAWQSTGVVGWTWLYDPRRRDASTWYPGPAFELSQPLCAKSANAGDR
jgi:4-amino-4-deoxy-L-arabinose transferase-like glycosyltransferase